MGKYRAGPLVLRHRRRAFKEQGERCFWCACSIYAPQDRRAHECPERRLTADHLITRKDGRDRTDIHAPWNIVASCYGCNHTRGSMEAGAFLVRIRAKIGELHFATVLQRLTKCGISVEIGQPGNGPDAQQNAVSPPPKVMAPAPA